MAADSEPVDDAVAQVVDPTDPPLPTWGDVIEQAGGVPQPDIPGGVFIDPAPGDPAQTQPGAPQQPQQPQPEEPTFSAPPPPLPDHLPQQETPPTNPNDPGEHADQQATHALLPDDDVIEAAEADAFDAEAAEADVTPQADGGGLFHNLGDTLNTLAPEGTAVEVLSGEHGVGQALHDMGDSIHTIAETVATAVEAHDVYDAAPADVHEAAAGHETYDHHDDGADE